MSLASLIGGAFRTRTEPDHDARPRSRRRTFRPSIDGLEGRELKDGGISLIAGTIQIEGTVADDSVIVSYADPSHNIVAVTWNNTTVDFQRSDVSGVRFDGQDGFNLF